jgi:YkoP domain
VSAGGRTRGGRAARLPHPPSAAARLLEPILILAERVDRRRRRIRPVRMDGLLGVELRRHEGPDVRLQDGTVVRRGDPLAEIHLRNEQVRDAARARGWVAIFGARRDLDALVRWCGAQPSTSAPVAVYAYSVLGAFLERGGFERRARRQTVRVRLDGWFMRWLLGRFSPAGQTRLLAGHGVLEAADYWLPVPRTEAAAGAQAPADGAGA